MRNLHLHTKEVIIGSEQGTTFPTRVGTTMCMSEEYYKKLQLSKCIYYRMLV